MTVSSFGYVPTVNKPNLVVIPLTSVRQPSTLIDGLIALDGPVTSPGHIFIQRPGPGMGVGHVQDRAIFWTPFVRVRGHVSVTDEVVYTVVYSEQLDDYVFVPGDTRLPPVSFDSSVALLADGRKALFREFFPEGISNSTPYIIRDLADPKRPAVYRDLFDVHLLQAPDSQVDIETSRSRLRGLLITVTAPLNLDFYGFGEAYGFNESATEWAVILIICGGVAAMSLGYVRGSLGAAGFIFLLMLWTVTYMKLADLWITGVLLLLVTWVSSYITLKKHFADTNPE